MRLDGIKELKKMLSDAPKELEADVKRTTKRHATSLQRKMVSQAFFSGPYTVGNIRRNIKIEASDGGMTYTVYPSPDYAPYVEYGTRFMGSQPFVRPAFWSERPLYLESLKRLVK